MKSLIGAFLNEGQRKALDQLTKAHTRSERILDRMPDTVLSPEADGELVKVELLVHRAALYELVGAIAAVRQAVGV